MKKIALLLFIAFSLNLYSQNKDLNSCISNIIENENLDIESKVRKIENLKIEFKSNDSKFKIFMSIARLYRNADNADNAAKHYTWALFYRKDLESYLFLCEYNSRNGNYDEAIRKCEQALLISPNDSLVIKEQIISIRSLIKIKEEDEDKELLKEYGEHFKLYKSGILLYRSGKYCLAYDTLAMYVALNKASTEGKEMLELAEEKCDALLMSNFEKCKNGIIEDCENYLKLFPNSKYVERVNQEIQSKKDSIENDFYIQAISGNIEECENFLENYPMSKFKSEVLRSKQEKIEYADYKKASIGSITDCQNYLINYPNGNYRESIVSRKKRLETIAINRNITSWNLGDRICTEDNPEGIIQGVIEQWNENKTKVKIKILGGYVGMYKGEDIYKGNMIWISTEGWYKCIGDESINYEIPAMSIGGGTYDRTKYKYSVGSKVQCRMWGNGNSGYDGVVTDKKDGKYLIKVTKVIVSGFFSTNLSPSECSGHVRLMYAKERFDDEGEGSVIWVSKDCVE